MPVIGLDHVNIVAADLEASARFYADVLGLERRDRPGAAVPGRGAWLCAGDGRAIVHLGSAARPGDESGAGGGSTGAINHVAFACEDFDAMVARLARLGVAYRASAPAGIGFRQIFLSDPDGVTLELNFADRVADL